MHKNIILMLFVTSLCIAQPNNGQSQRKRLYIKEKQADPGKTILNQLTLDMQEHFAYAARRMGNLRRDIKHLGNRKANWEFKEDLQSICNDVKDIMNVSLPRLDGGLAEIQ